MFNFFCTLHGVMYELETFKNVREVWTTVPFSCFSLLFFLKNWRVHSVTVTILLARRTCVFFFSRFLGERRQASWGRAGKKQHLQNRRCCFAFFRRARSGRGGRDTLALRAAGFVLAWKTRTLSVCSAGYHSLIKSSMPMWQTVRFIIIITFS